MKETSKLLVDTTTTISSLGGIRHPKDSKYYVKSLPNLLEYKIYEYLHYIYASLFYFMTTFFQQSVSPITDVLQNELKITSSGIGMLASAYFLTYFGVQIPFGMLLQKYSHHMILLTIAIGLSLCFILFGFIDSLISAILIRAFCGIFGAPTWLIIVTLIGENFGNNKIGILSGISLMFSYVLILVVITIQGFIYDHYHLWRETYYVLGIIGFLTVIAIILTMYSQKRKINQNRKKLLNATASWMHLFTQHSPRSIPTTFDINSRTYDSIIESPQESLEENNNNSDSKIVMVLSNYLNWLLGLYAFAMFTIFSSIFGLWLIPYLMLKFNYSRSMSSFFAGIATASVGLGSFVFGCLSSKFKNRKIYLIISCVLESSLLYLIYLDKDVLNEYVVFIIIVLSGFGDGIAGPLFMLVAEYNANNNCQETANGFVNAMMLSSGLISQYVIGILIDYHWKHNNNNNNEIRQYDVNDYHFAFSCVIPSCLAIAIIATLLLKETNGRNI